VKYAIDSGHATGEVYAFARRYRDARAVAIKGDSRASAPISQPSPIDVGPQRKSVRFGIRIWPVNGPTIKGELHRWLRPDRPTEKSGDRNPPGYCHFPEVQRGILQTDHGGAVGDQGSEGPPRAE